MDRFLEFLGSYGASLNYKSLPAEVIHEVKRRVIDSLGCAMGAYTAEPCKISRVCALEVDSNPGSTVLGSGHRSAPQLAAFANGVMVRYLDYNDTGGGKTSKEPGHPSDNIPAVLASAEYAGADAKTAITAIALAYEVQGGFSDAASLRKRGWDHVAYVSVSSAIGAGKAMGLDKEELSQAAALAATSNIPLRETRRGELSMWKGCAASNAARNGVFAALLARKGLTGPPEAFEGALGFLNQVTGPMELSPFGGDGRPFKILEFRLKYFPAEYNSHCAIHAALELRKKIESVQEVEAVIVDTFDMAVDIIADTPDKWRPTNRETADHSLPFLVAAALSDGTIGADQFKEERIRDPGLQALMQKVEVRRNQEFTREYPEANRTRVELVVSSGARHAQEFRYAKGHPKNPMTDAEVEVKFQTLTEPVLSSRQRRAILARLWHLEEVKDLREVLALFVV